MFTVLTGRFGARIPSGLSPSASDSCRDGDSMCYNWGNDDIYLGIKQSEDSCFDVSWSVKDLRVVEDCIGRIFHAILK